MHVLGCYSFIKNSRDKFVSYSRLILKNNPKFHSCTKGLGSQENKNDFSASNNGNPGVLLRILGGGVPPGSKNPDPISDKKKTLSTPGSDLASKMFIPFWELKSSAVSCPLSNKDPTVRVVTMQEWSTKVILAALGSVQLWSKRNTFKPHLKYGPWRAHRKWPSWLPRCPY